MNDAYIYYPTKIREMAFLCEYFYLNYCQSTPLLIIIDTIYNSKLQHRLTSWMQFMGFLLCVFHRGKEP